MTVVTGTKLTRTSIRTMSLPSTSREYRCQFRVSVSEGHASLESPAVTRDLADDTEPSVFAPLVRPPAVTESGPNSPWRESPAAAPSNPRLRPGRPGLTGVGFSSTVGKVVHALALE